MTIVVVGCVADRLGAASQLETISVNHPGRNFDVRHRYFSVPSTEYRTAAARVPVDIDHDPRQTIGDCRYLEIGKSGKLHAVCDIDASTLGEGPWYFSPEIQHYDGKNIELRSLAVTKRPASYGLGPIEALPWSLDQAAGNIVHQDGWQGAIVKRACAYDRKRRHGEPLVIHRTDTPPAATAAPTMSPPGRVEYRSAARLDVTRTGRIVELVAVPYNTDAYVHVDGRMVYESFSNTAFADVDKQPNRDRIHVTRDHDLKRLVGRVANLDPFHRDGLRAELKIAATPLGDETITLAREQLLDASIGFAILAGGQTWHGRTRRRVTRAHLAEISLVPEPAYAGTGVVAVRANRHPQDLA